MKYSLTFSKHASKELEKINDPFYSNLKQAIIGLSGNPRPNGYKKLKGAMVIESGLAITALFIIYLTLN